MNKRILLHILVILLALMPVLYAQEKAFTVVIDAGHGGHDAGAMGSIINEKEINLAVALKLGNLISENLNDVKVVFTRKTDRFIELDERANIANRNKANLFISIHTNSLEIKNKSSRLVSGTETFTLGLARTEENLEVAKRENSVILLEEDYQQKYEGFDPNSTESYIIFELMQNKYMEQSVSFASEIQKVFKSAKRSDRGVKQAGLLVLRKASMPSVLVELGFISNTDEERFLKSAEGQNLMAKSIYNAFVVYKRAFDKNKSVAATQPPVATTGKATATSTGKATTPDPKGETVYKIQLLATKTKIKTDSRQLKGYKDVEIWEDRGYYKYMYGKSTNLQTIKALQKKVQKDFKDAFIVPLKEEQSTKQKKL